MFIRNYVTGTQRMVITSFTFLKDILIVINDVNVLIF